MLIVQMHAYKYMVIFLIMHAIHLEKALLIYDLDSFIIFSSGFNNWVIIFQTISRDLMIEDEMGKRLKAIDVFSMSIAFLTKDMIEAGSKTLADRLRKDDVHWVLTVPAIWSDAAKQFMREASTREPVRKCFDHHFITYLIYGQQNFHSYHSSGFDISAHQNDFNNA